MGSSDRISFMISSPKYGYHCTTRNKLEKYITSGRIIAPVRFWPNIETAKRWCKRTGRDIILNIELPTVSYPLPDHKPAMFCQMDVAEFKVVAINADTAKNIIYSI